MQAYAHAAYGLPAHRGPYPSTVIVRGSSASRPSASSLSRIGGRRSHPWDARCRPRARIRSTSSSSRRPTRRRRPSRRSRGRGRRARARRRAGRRRRARAARRPRGSGGCGRARRWGSCTAPRTPRPAPMPRVSVVLPAPSAPVEHHEVAGAQLRRRGRAPNASIASVSTILEPRSGARRRNGARTRGPMRVTIS